MKWPQRPVHPTDRDGEGGSDGHGQQQGVCQAREGENDCEGNVLTADAKSNVPEGHGS